MYDIIVFLNLIVCNQSNKLIFEHRDRQSIADVTMVSDVLVAKITHWKIEDKPSLRDFNYITFRLQGTEHQVDQRNSNSRWKINL